MPARTTRRKWRTSMGRHSRTGRRKWSFMRNWRTIMTFFKTKSSSLTSLKPLIKSPSVGATKSWRLGRACCQERGRFVSNCKRISLNSMTNLPVFTTRVNALRACLNFGCNCRLCPPGIALLAQFSTIKMQSLSVSDANQPTLRPSLSLSSTLPMKRNELETHWSWSKFYKINASNASYKNRKESMCLSDYTSQLIRTSSSSTSPKRRW